MLPAEGTVVTFYDEHFANGRAELRRILDALHLPVSNRAIARATGACSPQLRHHRLEFARRAELPGQPPVPPDVWQRVVHYYKQLRAAGGMTASGENPEGKADGSHSARLPWLARCLSRAREIIRKSGVA
jgi:hypothetical protein